MGAEFSADVIVGVRVPSLRLFTKRRVKAFEHNHPKGWEVDPETGKSLWEDEEVFLLEGVATTDVYHWRRGEASFKAAKAVVIFDEGRYEERGSNAFIGRLIKSTDIGQGNKQYDGLCDVDMLAEKKFLEDLLTPFNFWNEKTFGIWLVGHVSG